MRVGPKLLSIAMSVWSLSATALAPITDSFDLVDLVDAGEVVVLDIRESVDDFESAHIPGARHLPYSSLRGPLSNPGQLLPIAVLEARLGQVGLRVQDALVIVHEGVTTSDFGAAARVYWTLKSLGFNSISILNGGFRGYTKDGFELESGPVHAEVSSLTLEFNKTWYASTAVVKHIVEEDHSYRLLDARLPAFFEGASWHDAAGRPGALPSADVFSFEQFFDANTPLLKDSDEITALVEKHGLNTPKIISYCNTGHWAATNWFVLSEVAQVRDVRLYAESMVEWSNTDHPMMNVPSAMQFAVLKTKAWLDRLGQ